MRGITQMLDDIKIITSRDSKDTLGVAQKQASQLLSTFEIGDIGQEEVSNVVFAGMGGSALYAEIVKSWPGLSVPFEIIKGYSLPAYVGSKTLVIASSFSGNTEETLTCLDQAIKLGAKTAVITSGGKLLEKSKNENLTYAQLNHSIPQPRMAVLEGFKALVTILDAYSLLLESIDALSDDLVERLNTFASSLTADTPTANNPAKQIAQELMGKSVVVYSSDLFYPVAYKWKISFNENAKNISWLNYYPEFNHNEFIGWSSHPIDKPYAILNLDSNLDNPRINKRKEISARLLSGSWPNPKSVVLEGETLIEQMLKGIILGDFTSIYLAVLNGVNPEPVELVEKLKKEL